MRYASAILVLAILMVSIPACGGNGTTPTAPTYPSGKPSGIQVTPGSESATLHWNSVAGAAGYYVYISYNGVNFSRYNSQPIRTTSFSIFDLTNGAKYYFGVSAVGSGGWESSIAYPGGAPMAVPVIPGQEPPPPINPLVGVPPHPPRNLQGVAKDAACEIHWDLMDVFNVTDFDYFRVYRSEDGGAFEMIIDVYDGTFLRDTDLINDSVYTYYVTAVDTENLESDPSNEVTLGPRNFPPEPLQNVNIYVNPGRIVLEWDVPLEVDIVKYAIERVEAIDPSGVEIISRFVIDKPTRTSDNPHIYANGLVQVYVDIARQVIVVQDMIVTTGIVYTYRVAALDASGQEGPPIEIIAPVAVY